MAEQTRRGKSESQDDKDEVQQQDKFAVDDLIARAVDFLGYPSHVVAAALHDRKAPLTLVDARQRIDTYLAEPVVEPANDEAEEA